MTLHEELIVQLMDYHTNLTPREHAARNEINALREHIAKLTSRVAELEGRKGALQTVEPAAGVEKRKK